MKLEYFQYILEVATLQSISKAAKKLYLSQPSLSVAIQNCEIELGFRIFDRSRQGVVLTEKGQQFCEIAQRVNQQLAQLKGLSEKEAETQTMVYMAAAPAFCNAMAIDLASELHNIAPEIHVDIQEHRPLGILPALAQGEASFGIGNYSERMKKDIYKTAAKFRMVIRPIFEDTMAVFLPGSHPLASRPAVALKDLAGEVPIYFNDYMLVENFDPAVPGLDIPDRFYNFPNRADIKKAISKGLGYAILPRQMAFEDVYCESGAIRVVPLAEANAKLTTFEAYPAGAELGTPEKKVLSCIRRLYANWKAQEPEA